MLKKVDLDEKRRLYHTPNFEEHILGKAWSNDKPWKVTKLITENFDQYQDGLMRYFNFVIGEEATNSLGIEFESQEILNL